MTVSKQKIVKYLEISTYGGADFHPDGNKICYVSNKSGIQQVYIKNLETGEVKQISEGENRSTNPVYLETGELLYSTDIGGNENFQMMIYSNNGSKYQLTSFLEAKHRFEFATEHAIYFSANILDRQRFDVYRYSFPLEEGMKEELILEGEPFIPVSPSLVNEEETILLVNKIKSNLSSDILLSYFGKDKTQNVTEKYFSGHDARFYPIEFLDEFLLLIRSDYDRDFLSLATFNFDSGELIYLEEDNWDTGRTILLEENDPKEVIFSKNIEGSDRLFKATLGSNKLADIIELALPDTEGILVSGDLRTFTRSFVINEEETNLLLNYSSPTSISTIYNLDLSNQQISTVIEPEDFDGPDFVDLTVHSFESFDGETIPYYEYTPEGDGPFPALFVIHGGPESQSRTGFSSVIQLFISEGYMVIVPNIRGSMGYGRRYLALDDIEKRLDSIRDIKELADHLKENNDSIDPDQLIIYGGSYGGFAVLSSIAEYPEQFDAAIDVVGISNFVTFLENTADWRRRLREVEYGFLDRHRELLESISPSNKVDQIQTPTFIVQGDNDERVPLSESIQIYNELSNRGVPTELLRFEDEGHGVVKRKNQITEYQQIFDFLEQYL